MLELAQCEARYRGFVGRFEAVALAMKRDMEDTLVRKAQHQAAVRLQVQDGGIG